MNIPCPNKAEQRFEEQTANAVERKAALDRLLDELDEIRDALIEAHAAPLNKKTKLHKLWLDGRGHLMLDRDVSDMLNVW